MKYAKRGRKAEPKFEVVDPSTITVQELATKYNEIVSFLNGTMPKSDRAATEDDARRILFGDLKDKETKEIAEELDLSYMQVYLIRKRSTFRNVKEIEA